MATHSNILAWKIPRTEEPGRGYSPWGHKESDMSEHTHRILMYVKWFYPFDLPISLYLK